jgi:membrane-associated protease RseP (regulator of RpoE activity)
MRRLLTLIFLAAVAVPAAAQDVARPARPPRPPRDTTVHRGYGYGYGFGTGSDSMTFIVGRHGRLGVVVDLGGDPARDSIGARITAVTPGSAADKAGVRTGDIVVQFNGTRLAGGDDRAGAAEGTESSRSGRRLIELASRLHTGDSVQLELRRENRTVNVSLVAGASGMEGLAQSFRMEPGRALTRVTPFPGGQMSIVFDRAPLANLELVKVNPGLAEYFGTSEGILVVDAPGDSSLGLRAGDVILAIGGRKPTSPSHAFRILGTYDPGESVGFELMRMKRHVNITGKMPERTSGWRISPNSFDFDELIEPKMDHMELLRDLPRMMEMPELLRGMERLPGELRRELPRGYIQLPPKAVNLMHPSKRLVET